MILEDIQFKESKWKGKINNPKKGVTANCELLLENGNKLKIVAKKGAMSKTVYWTKLD
ncbi:MAG: DUF2147 domain-containing protein [Microscillaceae bacterium]|nr:DUF2147 domain-containing protein [Microscillaceae bacterium]